MFDENIHLLSSMKLKPMVLSMGSTDGPPSYTTGALSITTTGDDSGKIVVFNADTPENKTVYYLSATPTAISVPMPTAASGSMKVKTIEFYGRATSLTLSVVYSGDSAAPYIPVCARIDDWGNFRPGNLRTVDFYFGKVGGTISAIYPQGGYINPALPSSVKSLNGFFEKCRKLPDNFHSLNMQHVTSVDNMFKGFRNGGNYSSMDNVTGGGLFESTSTIQNGTFYSTLKPTSAAGFMEGGVVPQFVPLNTYTVKNAAAFFKNAVINYLTQGTINSLLTQNMESMESMFEGAYDSREPVSGGLFSLSSWDLTKVKTMKAMFKKTRHFIGYFGQIAIDAGANNIVTQTTPYSEQNAPALLSTESMFEENTAITSYFNAGPAELTLGPSVFNPSQVSLNPSASLRAPNNTSTKAMFKNTSFNAPILERSYNAPNIGWTFVGVTDMSEMFMNNYKYDQSCFGWSTGSCTNFDSMFENAIGFKSFAPAPRAVGATSINKMFKNAFAFFDTTKSGWSPTSTTYGYSVKYESNNLLYWFWQNIAHANEAFFVDLRYSNIALIEAYLPSLGLNMRAAKVPGADLTNYDVLDDYFPSRNFNLAETTAYRRLQNLVSADRMFAVKLIDSDYYLGIAPDKTTTNYGVDGYLGGPLAQMPSMRFHPTFSARLFDCLISEHFFAQNTPDSPLKLASAEEMFLGCNLQFRETPVFYFPSLTNCKYMFAFAHLGVVPGSVYDASKPVEYPFPTTKDSASTDTPSLEGMFLGCNVARLRFKTNSNDQYSSKARYATSAKGMFAYSNIGEREEDVDSLQTGEPVLVWPDVIDMTNALSTRLTDVSYMFENTIFTGIDISLPTSNVRNYKRMFYGCTDYAGVWYGYVHMTSPSIAKSLQSFILNEATDMSFMFGKFNAGALTINLPTTWRTPKVTSMEGLVYQTSVTSFVIPIDQWQISNAVPGGALTSIRKLMERSKASLSTTNPDCFRNVVDASYAFAKLYYGNPGLQLPANMSWPALTNAQGMFYAHTYYTPTVGATDYRTDWGVNMLGWSMPAVQDAGSMFRNCRSYPPNISAALNSMLDLRDTSLMFALDAEQLVLPASSDFIGVGSMNTSKVTTMRGMFYGNKWFYDSVSNFDMTNVETIEEMFCNTFFNGAVNTWNFTKLKSMKGLFISNPIFNQDVNYWNTSMVTDMSWVFNDAVSFNKPLSNWNTINTTTMEGMFFNALAFNQPLNNWNTQNVTNMASMFRQTNVFNQPLTNWNTSKVTTMMGMFGYALAFNQNLSGFDTTNVTDMGLMFAFAGSMSSTNWGTIVFWDTSKVTNMYRMFDSVTTFNGNVGGWNVSKVTDFGLMFQDNRAFTQSLSNWNTNSAKSMAGMFRLSSPGNYPVPVISSFNTSNVTNFSNMFENRIGTFPTITGWNVGSGTNFSAMFKGSNFNQAIGGWNMSNAVNLGEMFRSNASFNQVIASWNVSKVQLFNGMFAHAAGFTQSITNWDVSSGTNFSQMFYCTFNTNDYAKPANIDTMLNNWGPKMLNAVNLQSMFHNSKHWGGYSLSTWNVGKVQDFSYMFCDGAAPGSLAGWNTSSAIYMNDMFRGTYFNSSINHFNTSNVVDFSRMFFGNTSFNQPLSNFNVSKGKSFDVMFQDCTSFNQNLSTWRPSSMTSAPNMFYGCTAWVVTSASGSLINWYVPLLSNATSMFEGCTKFNSPVTGWGTMANLKTAERMFYGCTQFVGTGVGNWTNAGYSLTSTRQMFTNCAAFNTSINTWTGGPSGVKGLPYVTDAQSMFYGCSVYNQPMDNFRWNACTNMTTMFYGASVFNKSLSGWCVPLITALPSQFKTSSPLSVANTPVWGTCPA